MKYFLAVITLGIIVNTLSHAQAAHRLTLPQSIEMAVQKGLVASDVTAQYWASRNRAESARRSQWTSLSLSVAAPDYSESLSQQFNPLTGNYEYYQLQSTNYQSSLVLNQPLTFTGGTLRLRQSLLGREQISGLSGTNNTIKNYFGDFSIELQQPILTSNQHRINAERADIGLEQAESDFLNAQLDLVYRVTESFYTLFQQVQRLEITKEQVKQNEESFRTAQSKFTGGLIPEVDVLQSDVDLASSRNDSLTGERELARAKNDFRLLLGIPSEEDVEVIAELSYTPVVIDNQKAIASALENRSDAVNAERDIHLKELGVSSAKAQNNFRFDISARYGVNKTDTLFKNIFQDFNRSRSASLTFSIPIFDWGSRGMNVEAAEIEYHNATTQRDYVRQQVRQETSDLLNRIAVAQSRIDVLQKSVTVAQQSYDISLQRFRNGTINRNDLAQAQQRLTAAKINSLNALIDYQLGIADLKRKTHWDFERNSPVEPIFRIEQ
jgi:outer membrane protein TolC